MPSSRVVEQQINNFREIDKIVGAMKAYAGSTVRKTEAIVRNVRVCEERLQYALSSIVARIPNFPRTRGDGKRILVAFGSSVGLCGMYNEKMADALVVNTSENDALLIIGKRLQLLADARKIPALKKFEAPNSLDGIKEALQESLASIRELYAMAEYYSLSFVFTSVKKKRADISIEQILPPDLGDMGADSKITNPILTYDNLETVFTGVLEELLPIILYRCYVEALCSENWFRLRAMEGATENLRKRVAELGSLQSYLRQEEATEEMIEILGSGMFYR